MSDTTPPVLPIGFEPPSYSIDVSGTLGQLTAYTLPIVAGHAYAVSKIMWLTVNEAEFQVFKLLSSFATFPLSGTNGNSNAVTLAVDEALSAFGDEIELIVKSAEPKNTALHILKRAKSEGCDFITARTL